MNWLTDMWDKFSGARLRKAHDDNTKASEALIKEIKMSREEKALTNISEMLRTGKNG